MKYLSVDPGLRALGWVYWDDEDPRALRYGSDALVPKGRPLTQDNLLLGLRAWRNVHADDLRDADVLVLERQWSVSFTTRLICEVTAVLWSLRDGEGVEWVQPKDTARTFALPPSGPAKKRAALAAFRACWPAAELPRRAHDIADAWLNLCHCRSRAGLPAPSATAATTLEGGRENGKEVTRAN